MFLKKNPKKKKKMVFFFKTWSNRRQRRKSKSVCDDVVWCGNGFSFGSSGILCPCDFGDDGDGERKLMWNRGRRRMQSMRTPKKTRPPLVAGKRERIIERRGWMYNIKVLLQLAKLTRIRKKRKKKKNIYIYIYIEVENQFAWLGFLLLKLTIITYQLSHIDLVM